MWPWLINKFKWWILREEMEQLHRLEIALLDVERWNASIPVSAATARWIREQTYGLQSRSISSLREELLMT